MTHEQEEKRVRSGRYPAQLSPEQSLVDRIKEFGPAIATFAAIAAATGAAFVALLWLDSLIGFFTPAVIRLGEQAQATPRAAKRESLGPADMVAATRAQRNRPDPVLGEPPALTRSR
jgi:hypothetical protein